MPLEIDKALVHQLIAEQFPQWSELDISPVFPGGWDNRTFHLGKEMLARLPSAEGYSLQAEKEQLWLPKLAPLLPLPIPSLMGKGLPSEKYPWHWSIYGWLDDETASLENIIDLEVFAKDLSSFLKALQQIDAPKGPAAGSHNWHRGGELAIYAEETQWAIKCLEGKIDAAKAKKIWELALSSSWKAEPVWVHGDIALGNLLVKEGRLSAVIDFGCLGVGDPACDLAMTWTFFHDESREVFRSSFSFDDSTWDRARGWVLWKALIVWAKLPGIQASASDIKKSQNIVKAILDETT